MSVDECVYLRIAKEQRETELERKQGLDGTRSYERMGCFVCSGFKEQCLSYFPRREVYKTE